MTPEATTAIAVIGPGRIGHSFFSAASAAGAQVSLAGRDEAAELASRSEVALLCVPDAEISAAAAGLADLSTPPRFVGHTSGAAGLDNLEAAGIAREARFSLHPLQTVPDGDTSLTGAPCAISGSTPEALGVARWLGELVGMRPFEIAEDDRATYHAAASIASNFLVALEQTATELLEQTGLENARELLSPLVLQSAANWAERGAEALTGPIARGDTETVERHVEAISSVAPELLPMYQAMAERTRAITRPAAGSTLVGEDA